ncbi:hypothetical protein [Aquimarina mytili]|uniref:Effector-associated domain-containing protein n=1 Tax=Aquimarina mytili TaxID=874423 RepID=A0A937D5H5_9FLAO|nr:hypothetical protein [Aquimarina mytili]MBL0683319.1 hypothetical protein [Aquimarina mytili]
MDKDVIKRFIAEGKTQKAIEFLLSENGNNKDIIILSGRYESINDLFRKNAVDISYKSIEEVKINNELLNLIEDLEIDTVKNSKEIIPSFKFIDNTEIRMDYQLIDKKEHEINYVDEAIGYGLSIPNKKLWTDPQYLNYFEYLSKLGLKGMEEELKMGLAIIPFGNMLQNSKHIIFQYGRELDIKYTDTSSTELIDKIIKLANKASLEENQQELDEQTIAEFRVGMFKGDLNMDGSVFSNAITIAVYEKKYAQSSSLPINLPNFFKAMIGHNLNESIDKLEAFSDSIMWVTKNKLLNLEIDNKRSNLSIFRANKLVENDEQIFAISVQYAPETDTTIEIWSELKDVFDSFSILSN